MLLCLVLKVDFFLIWYLGCDFIYYGLNCIKKCSVNCIIGCIKDIGVCYSCVEGKFGEYCDKMCGFGCVFGCD